MTKEHAPKTHNLPFLAEKAFLDLTDSEIDFLAEMTRWNLEARYPSDLDTLKKEATANITAQLYRKTEEILKCLKKILKKSC